MRMRSHSLACAHIVRGFRSALHLHAFVGLAARKCAEKVIFYSLVDMVRAIANKDIYQPQSPIAVENSGAGT